MKESDVVILGGGSHGAGLLQAAAWRGINFAAQYPACTSTCHYFACEITDAGA